MANRRPPWKIPAVIDPPERRCIQINVPDDPEHIAILWGVLRGLSDWQRWERESTKSGTLVAQVWSKVVYAIDWSGEECMGCCPQPTNRRYNSAGQLEVSYDNGANWVVDPSLDSRFSGIIAPPVEGEDGADKACAGAASAEEYVKQNLIDALQDGAAYADLNAAAVGLIALLGVTGIGLLIAGFAAAVFLAGVTVVQAAFTSEVWTTFRCILYCHISPDASFTEGQWNAVKHDILDQFTGVVSAILYNWVNSVGPVGLTNSARSHFVAAADCSSCECEPVGCNDKWTVQFGTFLGVFDDHLRFESIVESGTSKITMITDTINDCCALVDFTISPEELSGANPLHIDCGVERVPENIVASLPLGGCYNYVGFQLLPGDTRTFTVDIQFTDCA